MPSIILIFKKPHNLLYFIKRTKNRGSPRYELALRDNRVVQAVPLRPFSSTCVSAFEIFFTFPCLCSTKAPAFSQMQLSWKPYLLPGNYWGMYWCSEKAVFPYEFKTYYIWEVERGFHLDNEWHVRKFDSSFQTGCTKIWPQFHKLCHIHLQDKYFLDFHKWNDSFSLRFER